MTPVTIFVASPSDVAPERKLIRDIVDWANRTIARNHGVTLQAHTYEIDARPRAHPDGPQGPINEDLPVEKHDIVIGILWKRFGTPIPELGGMAGTQYELTRALRAQKGTPRKPEVVVCFSDAPFRRKEADPQQLEQVETFRKDFRGLEFSYDGPDDFREKFLAASEPKTRACFMFGEGTDPGSLPLALPLLRSLPAASLHRRKVKRE